jgi:hypothetical protein
MSSKKTDTECDVKSSKAFTKHLVSTITEIKEFNKTFCKFIEEERKNANALFNRVTRYNILNA